MDYTFHLRRLGFRVEDGGAFSLNIVFDLLMTGWGELANPNGIPLVPQRSLGFVPHPNLRFHTVCSTQHPQWEQYADVGWGELANPNGISLVGLDHNLGRSRVSVSFIEEGTSW